MRNFLIPLLFFSLVSVGCGESADSTNKSVTKPQNRSTDTMNYEKATFAAGCFWCMESPFEKLDGVSSVISGYISGHVENPTYEQVSSGTTGHTEAVQVTYDPETISYQGLLDVFWRQFDPTDGGGSFHDRGSQYRSGIFYHNDEQKKLAEASKQALDASGKFDQPISTEITEATTFYPAEDYHQDYYKKNPIRYNYYRSGSGRDKYIENTWGDEKLPTSGKPSENELKTKLTPLQYQVTQENGTEAPFQNEYWDNHQEGIYVGIVSGEPLFSSQDKFESGTGWPSFTKPLIEENVVDVEDNSLFRKRVEVRSKKGDSHLGHVFPDGPQPTGQRYCINSASLRFIPKEDLKKEGYEKFLSIFNK